jgi:hypothetical protein
VSGVALDAKADVGGEVIDVVEGVLLPGVQKDNGDAAPGGLLRSYCCRNPAVRSGRID